MKALFTALAILASLQWAAAAPNAGPCAGKRFRAEAYPGLKEALQALAPCPGPVALVIDDTLPVTGDLVVPAKVNLQFEAGGRLKGRGNPTVTVLGHIAAAEGRIFENVRIKLKKAGPGGGAARNASVIPQWWGAVADDAGDDAEAITDALNTAWRARRTLVLPGGTYMVSKPITVSGDNGADPATWDQPLWIRGDDAALQATAANPEGVMRIEAATPDRGGGSGAENKIINGRINISGVFFQTSREKQGYGLRVYGANGVMLSDMRFKDFAVGLQIWNVDLVTVRDCYFEHNVKGLEQNVKTRIEKLLSMTGEGANSWNIHGNFFLMNDTSLHISTGTGIRIESNEFATHNLGILLGALERTRHNEHIETAAIRANRFESDYLGRAPGRHHIVIGNAATVVKNVVIEQNDFIAQNGGEVIRFERTDRWCLVRDNRIRGPKTLTPVAMKEGKDGGRQALWVTSVPLRSGRVAVMGASSLSDTVWFRGAGGRAMEQYDAEYQVIATPHYTRGGKADAGAYVVVGVRKTVEGFVIETSAAPGKGREVYFDWVVLRDKGDVND